MQDGDKTKEQLIQELNAMRQRVAELASVEERYHNLFQYAGDSVFLIDLLTFAILDTNADAARRLKYTREELLQLTLDDIEVHNVDGTNQLAWESAFSGTRVYECHYRRKDGSLVPVEVSSRLVKIGEQAALQNFVRDISKRKEVEAELKGLVAELNAFAHTVAHDLRAPLGLIMGYANILLADFDELSAQQMKDYLRHIERGGNKMNNIIHELLVLASVREVETIGREPLNMAQVVNEALLRLGWMIDDLQAEIILPDNNTWPVALGYAAWVEEVWTNYISNAMKYGGTPPRVELGADIQDEGMVRFWVRDNGPGIPPEQQKLLFNPFTRLDEVRAQGYGVGLSIVRRIVEKLGGHVGVDSRPEQGSTFHFSLPTPQ